MARFLAFDLGAESGRAIAADLTDGGRIALTTLGRYANRPRPLGTTLRWDVDLLWGQMRDVLDRLDTAPVSIGVDAWGCDYALLDETGALVEPPWHYRDHRTDGVMDDVLARLGRSRVYGVTGIQFLPFNTMFQLAAAMRLAPSVVRRAAHLVTIPDLMNHHLTGRVACEFTSATTTQCVDARARDWARPLIEDLGLPSHLFGPIVEPGTVIGTTSSSVGRHAGTTVVAPACHDTGSAVAAVAADDRTAFLSSGTWSLLGVELPAPIITTRSAALNLTNEGGVAGTTRLLKNVTGLWLLQACRRAWATRGANLPYDALAAEASAARPFGPVIDPDAPAFLNPDDMPEAIVAWCRRTGQDPPVSPAAVARTIFESLALKYRLVLEGLEEVSARSIATIRVIGGGAQNALLNQLTADATGRRVAAGPVEATALGNLAMQMLATGHVGSLGEARHLIDRSFPPVFFEPTQTDRWDAHYRRFRECLASGDRAETPVPTQE